MFAWGTKISLHLYTESLQTCGKSGTIWYFSGQNQQVGENAPRFVKPPFLFSTTPPLPSVSGRLLGSLCLKTVLHKTLVVSFLCLVGTGFVGGRVCQRADPLREALGPNVSLCYFWEGCVSVVSISGLISHTLKYFLGLRMSQGLLQTNYRAVFP